MAKRRGDGICNCCRVSPRAEGRTYCKPCDNDKQRVRDAARRAARESADLEGFNPAMQKLLLKIKL